MYSCNQTNVDSYCCFDGCKCNDEKFETFSFPDLDVYTLTIIGEPFTQTHTSSASSTPSPSSSDPATQSSNAAVTSATAINTATNAPASSTPSSEPASDNSVSIGVGVGVSIGAALLIGAGVFFFFWRRNKKQKQQDNPSVERNPYVGDEAATTHGLPKNYAEMDNTEMPSQYYPPTQKYAYFASDTPVPPSQRYFPLRFF